MRDLLRGSLKRTLGGIRDQDRLAAAWTVACGRAMAEHGAVVDYAQGIVRVEASDPMWMKQMISLGAVLQRELARISGLPVAAIHFELKKS
ncbi:MAG TPA: DciA family protein [Acidobacteriaceae bacterium]|nr:DciA family protein [Acidobacteriaceae bacterium]